MAVTQFPQRLDVYLVSASLAPSRELAKKLILASAVKVNSRVVTKPSYLVEESDEVLVEENEELNYVSRGALKLKCALDTFGIDVTGMTAVDFGASTGGFTDLLLQRGAERVYAIENGSNQLHEKLLKDNRVISYDNTNARYIEKGFIPLCDIAVMDVSFISQTKLYQSVVNCIKNNAIFISLIKPQFEAGKQFVGKNGIVKDPDVHNRVIENIISQAELFGLKNISVTPSSILGGDGNREFLAYFRYEKE